MNRFLLKQFAENGNNNGVFGSFEAGSPQISNNEATLQSLPAWSNGWKDAVSNGSYLPRLEEFQTVEYLLCKAVKELYSEGIPFWADGETYYINSVVSYFDISNPYALYQNITGVNTSTIPPLDTTNWKKLELGGGNGGALNLFEFKWSDHKFNDVSWVNATDYSWLAGSVYEAGYNLLDNQMNPVGSISEGATNFICNFTDGEIVDTGVAITGTLSDLETWATAEGYTYSGATIEEFEVVKTLTSSSETIVGTTITYYETYNGMKIIDTTEISNAEQIYSDTGCQWYYIFDSVNERFKLPRINPAREKLITLMRAKGNGKSLGLTDGTKTGGLAGHSGNNYSLGISTTGYNKVVGTTITPEITDLKAFGVVTDPTKSGIIIDSTDSDTVFAGSKYLYFYVGNFTQTAIENTAGLNADLFNGKADTNLRNVDVASGADAVIEFQRPTSDNNYTWYRKYASGWVEQGGYNFFSAYVQNAYIVQALPIPMADINYQVTLNCESRNQTFHSGNNFFLFSDNYTTTTFVYAARGGDNKNYKVSSSWEVKGFAAS